MNPPNPAGTSPIRKMLTKMGFPSGGIQMGKYGIISCAYWCNGCKDECPKYGFECPKYRCVRETETPPSFNKRSYKIPAGTPHDRNPVTRNNVPANGGCP